MAMHRLMSVAQAAGCAMAPTVEYLDGPSGVMPRPKVNFSEHVGAPTGSTALTVSWQEPARTQRFRELVGSFWYGRATPA